MTRKKVKLAWVANESSRVISLKKRRLGLVKKARELTILCDVKGCMIIFSPNEAEPTVWPSAEAARDLLDDFFALPEIEKKKKEMTLESYLKEKTGKVQEQWRKSHTKNTEHVINQLMMQLHHGRAFVDLNLNEIHKLLSFSKDKIMLLRKRLDSVEHLPLRDPPVHPFEAQSKEYPKITKNNVFVIGGSQDDRLGKNDEAMQRVNIGSLLRDNQSHYLMDKWFPASTDDRLNSRIHQRATIEDPNPRSYLPYQGSYLPYQGSSSNGNPNWEMEPIGPPVMTFSDLLVSVSQPLQQHHNMSNNPIMDISQPRQYPFDFMNRGLGMKEEGSNINNGDPQFHCRSNTVTTNDGLRQEPPPPDRTSAEEGDADAISFDIYRDWPRINNPHF